MGGLRTIALILSLLSGGQPARAADDPLRLLAGCAGRYSATVEHLWLVDGRAADAARVRRDVFVGMVAAFPAPQAAMALHWRVETKAAHRALLDRGLFGPDAGAARRAADWLAFCDSLLPGA